jgi:hypothetical protein
MYPEYAHALTIDSWFLYVVYYRFYGNGPLCICVSFERERLHQCCQRSAYILQCQLFMIYVQMYAEDTILKCLKLINSAFTGKGLKTKT